MFQRNISFGLPLLSLSCFFAGLLEHCFVCVSQRQLCVGVGGWVGGWAKSTSNPGAEPQACHMPPFLGWSHSIANKKGIKLHLTPCATLLNESWPPKHQSGNREGGRLDSPRVATMRSTRPRPHIRLLFEPPTGLLWGPIGEDLAGAKHWLAE